MGFNSGFKGLTWLRFYLPWHVFPRFFLSCKANATAKLAKTGHGPHSSTLVVICVVHLLFVLFYVLFVCKRVLPPGDNPTAVNKYIISFLFNSETELNTQTKFVSLDEKTKTQNSLNLFISELKHLCTSVFTKATPTCNMRDKPGESSYCCVSCHDITLCSSNTREREFYRCFGVLSWKIRLQMTGVKCHKRVRHTHNTEHYQGTLHVLIIKPTRSASFSNLFLE